MWSADCPENITNQDMQFRLWLADGYHSSERHASWILFTDKVMLPTINCGGQVLGEFFCHGLYKLQYIEKLGLMNVVTENSISLETTLAGIPLSFFLLPQINVYSILHSSFTAYIKCGLLRQSTGSSFHSVYLVCCVVSVYPSFSGAGYSSFTPAGFCSANPWQAPISA